MTFLNLIKEKELRKKLYYTIFVLAVAQLFTQIPIPGINSDYLQEIFSRTSVLSLMDNMSGGSLSHLSLAGFGITTYITATIIVQLMGIIFPSIENIRKDGEKGRKLLERVSLILMMVITFISSLAMSIGYGRNGMFTTYDAFHVALAVCSWMLGSFILISLAQKVEENGVGNGITLVLGFNILSRIPSNLVAYYKTDIFGRNTVAQVTILCLLTAALFVFFLIGVYLQCGTLYVPIKQTKKSASIMNSDANIPMSVNIANVLPVIYASTLVAIPLLIQTFTGFEASGKLAIVFEIFDSSNWYMPTKWYHPIGLVIYILLIVVFGFFASEMSFNSADVANNMRKNGNVIPYVQPGEDTVAYLERRRKILSVVNVLFLIVLSVLPDLVCTHLHVTFSFLGTSLIIVIAMLFDTALRLRAVSIHNDNRFNLFYRKEKR